MKKELGIAAKPVLPLPNASCHSLSRQLATISINCWPHLTTTAPVIEGWIVQR